jgi:hypothetical protein
MCAYVPFFSKGILFDSLLENGKGEEKGQQVLVIVFLF